MGDRFMSCLPEEDLKSINVQLNMFLFVLVSL